MSNNIRHDELYEPPTKEFIRNSLLYGLLSENESETTRLSSQTIADGYTDLGLILKNKGKLESTLIKYAYSNKRRIKRIPWFDKYAMSVKMFLLRRAQSGIKPSSTQLDLTAIMGLEVNDFIWQLYIQALGRPPDDEGLRKYKHMLCSGATPEAVAYIICTSKEFADRAQVAYLDKYRIAFRKYRIRDGLRRLPLIGWGWAIAAIPNRIYRLEVEERIRHVDSLLLDRQRFESLMSFYQSLQARVDDIYSMNSAVKGDLESALYQFNEFRSQLEIMNTKIDTGFEDLSLLKVLQAQLEALNSEIKAEFSALSVQNITTKNQLIELSRYDASLNARISKQGEILTALETANQNIVSANVKLDEAGKLIVDTASRNRPVIYGLSGGVTVVQTKEYFIGVPSEEWRLAVFLNTYGFFELGTEKYFRSILKEGMNVIDVGAYLGIYSLHALAAGCHVYSYEPTPKIFDILVDNIGINGYEPTHRANIYNLAVCDANGEASFSIIGNGMGQMNSLFASSPEDKAIRVKSVRLDDHLAKLDRVDIAKIDVEGAEPLVLKGMEGIINKNPGIIIIMEFAPSHLRRGGKDPLAFISDIHSLGMNIQLIHEESGDILDISDEELCSVFSVNILLTKSV
jgi:FkbM family methyltransferase